VTSETKFIVVWDSLKETTKTGLLQCDQVFYTGKIFFHTCPSTMLKIITAQFRVLRLLLLRTHKENTSSVIGHIHSKTELSRNQTGEDREQSSCMHWKRKNTQDRSTVIFKDSWEDDNKIKDFWYANELGIWN
jgi:hypothetical protein